MSLKEFLPWHQDNWAQLRDAIANDRLAHGLLLRGSAGLGKGHFATVAASCLLCKGPGATACGECRDCLLLASGNHPDFIRIAPAEDKKLIVVDQIRDLIDRLTLTSQMQGYRVIIINPADVMNISAQNSLLKTLEEPRAKTVLFLVSSQPAGLAATVLSRCQSLRFASPPTAMALDWLSGQGEADWPQLLQMAWGAPLRALALAGEGVADKGQVLADELRALVEGRSDPISLAEVWAGDAPVFRMRWLQQQTYGLIQWQVLGQAPELVHKTLQRSLQNRIAALSLTESYGYLDRLQFAIGLMDRQVNQALMLMPLLSAWDDGPRFGQISTDTL